jgi:hypothetical protein
MSVLRGWRWTVKLRQKLVAGATGLLLASLVLVAGGTSTADPVPTQQPTTTTAPRAPY